MIMKLVEICRALLQILHSDWLSHRVLFVIVHDEHKQDGGSVFLQSLRREDIIFTANSNYLNFSVCKFLLKQIVYSLSWSLNRSILSAHRPLKLVYYLLNITPNCKSDMGQSTVVL